MTGSVRARRFARPWTGFLVFVLAWLPYLRVLDAPFVFDDVKLVRDNAEIRDLSRIPATFNVFSKEWENQEVRANYRPMRFLSYALDHAATRWLFDDPPPERLPTVVFHLQNVLLHALNAVLVLAIGRALLGDGRPALVLAALFALHPIATEAVTYISGRRDVLSTFFFLAALLAHLQWRDRWLGVLATPALFVLGLLSKEMVVTLPAAILLIELSRRARPSPPRVASLCILWALALAFAWIQASDPGLVAGAVGGSKLSTLLTAPRYLGRYLGLALLPYPQSIDYSFDAIPVSTGLLDPWTTLPCLLLALGLLFLGLWALARRRVEPAVGLLWFVGTLVPVLQIVPIPERFAERFLYLPIVGILLLAAAAFRALHARAPNAAWSGAGAALLLLGLLTFARNEDWRSPVGLWESAAEAQPRAARAHLGHADALSAEPGGARDAVQAFTRALEILGEEPPEAVRAGDPAKTKGDELLRWGQALQAKAFRANSFAALGAESSESYRKAIADYRWLLEQRDIDGTSIADSPKHLVLRYDLANALLGLAQAEPDGADAAKLRQSAAGEFRMIAAAGPSTWMAGAARYYLGKLALAEKRAEEGLKEIEEAFRIACASGGVMDRYRLAGELSDLLIGRKDLDRADGLLQGVIAEMGTRTERRHLLYRRAKIADRKGDLAGSARLLLDSLAIDPEFAPALLSLAGLEEVRGNLERAEDLYRRVLKLAPAEPRALRGLKGVAIRRDLAKKDAGTPGERGPGPEGAERAMLEGLIARGDGHLSRGEYLAAAEPFRRAAATPPDGKEAERNRDLRAKALRRLGAVAVKLGKFPEAEGYLSAAIAADPESHDALRDLADFQLRDLKDRAAAARTYEEYFNALPAGRLDLASPFACVNLARLIQEREPSRAAELYLLARKAGHRDAAFSKNLGYLLVQLGRFDEALEVFQEFLDASAAEAGGGPLGKEARARERDEVRKHIEETVLPRVQGGEALRARRAEEKR